jgi:hypothetical protein
MAPPQSAVCGGCVAALKTRGPAPAGGPERRAGAHGQRLDQGGRRGRAAGGGARGVRGVGGAHPGARPPAPPARGVGVKFNILRLRPAPTASALVYQHKNLTHLPAELRPHTALEATAGTTLRANRLWPPTASTMP